MQGRSILKVKGGKLIKTRLDYDDGKIKRITITGDFFIHPEEGIESIEKDLIGAELDIDRLQALINGSVEKNGIVLFGIDPESLASGIMGCAKGDGEG